MVISRGLGISSDRSWISGAEVSWSVQGNAVILRVCMIRCMHGEQDGEGMCRSSMERVAK